MPKDNKDKKHSKKESKSQDKATKKRDKKSDAKQLTKEAESDNDKKAPKERKGSNVSATSAESLQSKTTRSKSEGQSQKEGGKIKKSEQRLLNKQKWKDDINAEKKYLEEKYDGNLKDSDDSSDEENLLRNGNVP